MAERATLRDVAAAAHVSVSTASMALSGSPRVASATRQRVIDCASELNYTPDPAAQALAGHRPRSVSVMLAPSMIDDFGTSSRLFAHRLLRILNERLAEAGLMVSQIASTDNRQLAQASLLVLVGDDEEFDALQTPDHLPTVLAGRPSNLRNPAAVLVHDHSRVATDLLEHLADQAVSRLAIVRHTNNGNYAGATESAIRQAAHQFDIAVDTFLTDFTAASAREASQSATEAGCDSLLLLLPFPAAAIEGIQVTGKRVPDDIVVIGRGEGVLEEQVTPPVTALSMMAVTCGEILADTIHQVFAGGSGIRVTLPHSLQIRQSSLRP